MAGYIAHSAFARGLAHLTGMVLLLGGLYAASLHAAEPAPKGDDLLAKTTQLIQEKTNAFRRTEKLPLLKADSKLTATAEYFSAYMAKTKKHDHQADGKRPEERAKERGYAYCLVSENIAHQPGSQGGSAEQLAERFFAGWKKSPPHRKNMLDPDMTESGIAVARSPDTGHYYAVQMFGRPKSASVRFEVANQSGMDVEYRIEDRKYTVPADHVRSHQECRPPELAFVLPAGSPEEQAKVRPESGETIVVRRSESGGLSFQKNRTAK